MRHTYSTLITFLMILFSPHAHALFAVGNSSLCVITDPLHVTCAGTAGSSTIDFTIPVVWLESGNSFTCAQLRDHTIQCWGNNQYGQLGNGTLTNSTTPVVAKMPVDAKLLSLGAWHACAVGPDIAPATNPKGNIYCWGDNSRGQLAIDLGVKGNQLSTPSQINIKSQITHGSSLVLTAGHDFTCLLVKKTGRVWCWGGNTSGEIGDGTNTDATVPMMTQFEPGDVVKGVSAGESHVCALLEAGNVKCWGNNENGQLGNGKGGDGISSNVPTLFTQLDPADSVHTITAGRNFTCFVLTTRKLKCVGAPEFTKINQDPENQDIVYARSAIGNLCALKADYHLKCWGDYIGKKAYEGLLAYNPLLVPEKKTAPDIEVNTPPGTPAPKTKPDPDAVQKKPEDSTQPKSIGPLQPIVASPSGSSSCSLTATATAASPVLAFLAIITLTGLVAYRSQPKKIRIKHKITTAIITVLTLVGLQHSAFAALQVNNEAEFKLFMEKIGDGTITSDKCTDPNPDYDKYCYVEITKSFELTAPIAIPARVHLVGISTDGQKPVITATYNVALNKSAPPCILSFVGDQVSFENITLNAFTYKSVLGGPYNVDNAICMKANYGSIKDVAINSPGATAPIKFVAMNSNGITVIGKSNFIKNNIITLKKSVGLVLNGGDTTALYNFIATDYFSVLVQNKDPGKILGNTISGKISFLFPSAFDVPLGQAANILLLNTYKDTLLPADPENENQSQTFEGRYQKTLEKCGTCKGISGDEKVLYADDGTCNKVPASGACMELKGAFAPMQLAIAQQTPDSELQINQNAPPPTVLSATTLTPGSELETKTAPAEPSGGGGCSLIR